TLRSSGDAGEDRKRLERLVPLFRDHFAGDDLLYIQLEESGRRRLLRSSFRIDWCEALDAAISEVVGPNACAAISSRSLTTSVG
ncbi:MAG TPA: hypothetical protein VFV93_09840, partial [Thermomicrobiales bacterium]|nr:hypothetical protein [Thermomicrobiales bacterium]